jgi:hypothetical protein
VALLERDSEGSIKMELITNFLTFIKQMDPIEVAYQCALKSTLRKRYGCVITHRNKIVGIGYNRDISCRSKRKQCLL